jgi:tRNA A-37 threonylcarbamoyl transferase component Bud32
MEPLSANDPQAVGEFKLHARLGAGGMGRVYLGYSRAGRAVAVKVIHPELARDPEFRHRFSREVAAARAVSGMYTAPVVADGVNADPPWLATAYVPGPSLSDVVSRHGPLPEAATWRLAAGLAEALGAVHACGLVHRDLKPANVLLAPDGPHVIDFGISRACDGTSVTATGSVVGTPGYMSPEQAEAAGAGPPSDVFSLGCVLAYAATGNAPFGTGSAASVLYRVVTAQPDLTRVPSRLRDVITACLAKDPAQRPGVAALGAMISQAGPAVVGPPTSFWPDDVAQVIRGAGGYPTRVGPPPAHPAPPSHPLTKPAMVPDGYLAAATASLTSQRAAGGQTSPMTSPPQGAGAAWSPAAGAPWAQPPAADALSRYTPAPPRPRPPTSVLAAAWLMYSGAALSVLSTLVDLAIIGEIKTAFLASHPLLPGNTVKSFAAGASAGVLVAGGVVVALWLWLAYTSKQGASWARTVGTVLFGVDTFFMLATLGTRGIGLTKGIGAVVWLIALVTVIMLWQRSASGFFAGRR